MGAEAQIPTPCVGSMRRYYELMKTCLSVSLGHEILDCLAYVMVQVLEGAFEVINIARDPVDMKAPDAASQQDIKQCFTALEAFPRGRAFIANAKHRLEKALCTRACYPNPWNSPHLFFGHNTTGPGSPKTFRA